MSQAMVTLNGVDYGYVDTGSMGMAVGDDLVRDGVICCWSDHMAVGATWSSDLSPLLETLDHTEFMSPSWQPAQYENLLYASLKEYALFPVPTRKPSGDSLLTLSASLEHPSTSHLTMVLKLHYDT